MDGNLCSNLAAHRQFHRTAAASPSSSPWWLFWYAHSTFHMLPWLLCIRLYSQAQIELVEVALSLGSLLCAYSLHCDINNSFLTRRVELESTDRLCFAFFLFVFRSLPRLVFICGWDFVWEIEIALRREKESPLFFPSILFLFHESLSSNKKRGRTKVVLRERESESTMEIIVQIKLGSLRVFLLFEEWQQKDCCEGEVLPFFLLYLAYESSLFDLEFHFLSSSGNFTIRNINFKGREDGSSSRREERNVDLTNYFKNYSNEWLW